MAEEKVLNDDQLVFEDEKGNEVLCDIIFTYHSEEFNKDYVFFAQNGSEDEDGKVEVGVASYIPTNGAIGELNAVETDEEWDMLEEVFNAYAEDSECDCDCDCDECSEEDCESCGCDCCHHE